MDNQFTIEHGFESKEGTFSYIILSPYGSIEWNEIPTLPDAYLRNNLSIYMEDRDIEIFKQTDNKAATDKGFITCFPEEYLKLNKE